MAPHIAIALNEYRSPGRKDHIEDFFVCEYMYIYLHYNLSVHCTKHEINVVDALSKLNLPSERNWTKLRVQNIFKKCFVSAVFLLYVALCMTGYDQER